VYTQQQCIDYQFWNYRYGEQRNQLFLLSENQLFLLHELSREPDGFENKGTGWNESSKETPGFKNKRTSWSLLCVSDFWLFCCKTIWFFCLVPLHDRPAGSIVLKTRCFFGDSYQLVSLYVRPAGSFVLTKSFK